MSAPPSHAQAPRPVNLLGDIDALIDDARNAREVPSQVLGIVIEGRIAHTSGFGVRKFGEPAVVDGDTVFTIASLTKSFAAVTTGQLVDAGRLGWNDRVIDHLPFFALYDDAVTQAVTIRDLLAMRTGISESTNIFRTPTPRAALCGEDRSGGWPPQLV
jgi:CubicO group peptidase (beta-lactamase class C family)